MSDRKKVKVVSPDNEPVAYVCSEGQTFTLPNVAKYLPEEDAKILRKNGFSVEEVEDDAE